MEYKELNSEEILSEILQNEKDSLLELSERVGGNPAENMAGYAKLAQFYKGGNNQWERDRPEGRTQKTFNYMYATVENFTTMLSDAMPMWDVPPTKPDDDAEIARADAQEKLLYRVIEDNSIETFIQDLAKSGSQYGDAFIHGPFYEKTPEKKIRFYAIENPASVSIGWRDDKWIEKDWAIIRTRVSLAYANKQWGDYFKSIGEEIKDDATNADYYWRQDLSYQTTNKFKFVKVIHYWTENKYCVVVNNRLVQEVEHNWGFIPLEHIPNIKKLGTPWGLSDLEQAMDAQVDYNEMTCNEADVIQVVAFPKYVGVNVEEDVKSWRAGISQIFLVGPDADIKPLPSAGSPYPIKDYMEGSLQRIYDLTGMTEIAYGRGLASNVSGRAVNVAMQVTVNKLKGKKIRIKFALERMAKNIFILLEKYFPDTKQIINGYYKTDIYWNDGMIRDAVEEINKLNAGVQSKYTTMKNLGIASPKDEFKLIEQEKMNEAKLMAQVQAAMTPQQAPQLSEGENQPGEMPMAQTGTKPGVPVTSPEAAARMGV